jgi:hypothetical protein
MCSQVIGNHAEVWFGRAGRFVEVEERRRRLGHCLNAAGAYLE